MPENKQIKPNMEDEKGVPESSIAAVEFLQKENVMLKQRIVELQQENHQMKEIASANERFKQLLEFREKISHPTIAAEVIGQDPSSWFRSVTINKGEKEGAQKGMAVISPAGVIGQILKTAPHYAVVLLLTDYNSAIDSIIQRTRAKAIVEGRGENRCQLKYLLRTEGVIVGDSVVTSGLSGNFPKGLMVGEVRKVDKKGHGVFQYARGWFPDVWQPGFRFPRRASSPSCRSPGRPSRQARPVGLGRPR
jgi:rod shape-determining protein MreC